ncbi:MAG: ATP-grasp domain-containing protein [Acidobacteriota bacterium]|nr:ATP-grasp domain-containing protein [Acidobacteriota bacterium]
MLIIGHLAGPSLEELHKLAEVYGLKSFILTSPPLDHIPERVDDLRDKSAWLSVTPGRLVTLDDVEQAIAELRHRGWHIRAAITRFEAYRALMAAANRAMGVEDLAPAHAEALLDKLHVRKSLHDSGISSVRGGPLTELTLAEAKESGQRWFVKPTRGTASFAAFPLSQCTTIARLQQMAQFAADDAVFGGVMNDRTTFMLEDYIDGVEASVEVIVVSGQPYVVSLHEKVLVTELLATTLEDVFVAPPWTLAREQIAACVEWVSVIMRHLDITAGCYNLDAKVKGQRWELLEINPRMGGFLVSESVLFTTGVASLLEIWIESLLDPPLTAGLLEQIAIPPDGSFAVKRCTLFRQYFSSPGTIREVKLGSVRRLPEVLAVYARPGDRIPERNREEVLGEALWSYDGADDSPTTRAALLADSEEAVKITYELTDAALYTGPI